MLAVVSVLALAFASSVLAQPSPLTPATADEGANCVISWSPDTTGTWTQTNIQLMSGSNLQMIPITTVATVDTTSASATTYTWPCPAVTPNSAIYFYQFSHSTEPNALQWTTRFAIASTTGAVTAPANSVQPDATHSAIPWGIGALVDPSTAKPAPAYITGEGVEGTTANSTVSAVSSMSMSMSMSNGSMSASTSNVMGGASSTGMMITSATTSTASSTASTTTTATANAAGLTQGQGSSFLIVFSAAVAGLFAMV